MFVGDQVKIVKFSPDIATLDNRLSQHLQNSLNENNFSSLEDCKKHLAHIFKKDKMFWENGILKFSGRQQKNNRTKQ